MWSSRRAARRWWRCPACSTRRWPRCSPTRRSARGTISSSSWTATRQASPKHSPKSKPKPRTATRQASSEPRHSPSPSPHLALALALTLTPTPTLTLSLSLSLTLTRHDPVRGAAAAHPSGHGALRPTLPCARCLHRRRLTLSRSSPASLGLGPGFASHALLSTRQCITPKQCPDALVLSVWNPNPSPSPDPNPKLDPNPNPNPNLNPKTPKPHRNKIIIIN